MPRNVLIVSDEGPATGGATAGADRWTQVVWSTFSRQLLESSQADVLVVVAPASGQRHYHQQQQRNRHRRDGAPGPAHLGAGGGDVRRGGGSLHPGPFV